MMKIRKISDLLNGERHIKGKGFDSIRAVLRRDNIGFSVHKTIIPKGGPYDWHYKNHKEVCYCISGKGIIRYDGGYENIDVDSVYILDDYDKHSFEALEDTVLISIFNPPVEGDEVHSLDGSYHIDHLLLMSDYINAIKSIISKMSYEESEECLNMLTKFILNKDCYV